jgi:biotin synthase-related radical SAM superfamily protein
MVRIVREEPSMAVRRVGYQSLAEYILSWGEVDFEDVKTVPSLVETILCDLEVRMSAYTASVCVRVCMRET